MAKTKVTRKTEKSVNGSGLVVDTSKHVGYVGIMGIPALTVPYEDLQDIALDTGINPAYLPDKGKAKHSQSAWAKAMNLGARGVTSKKLAERFARHADKAIVNKAEIKLWNSGGIGYQTIQKMGLKSYQLEIRYIIRDVSGAVPTKHLYRELYVRTDRLADNARSDKARKEIAETQLSSVCVAILEYVTSGNKSSAKYTMTPESGDFDRVIRDNILMPAYARHMDSADSQRIRVKLAEGLKDNSGLPARQGGGVVIFPAELAESEVKQLNAIRAYLDRLADYMDKPVLKSGLDATKPSLQLLPVTEDSLATFDYVSTVNQELTNELTDILEWADKIDPKTTKPKHAENFNTRAKALYDAFQEKLRKYQTSMGQQISVMGDLAERVDKAMVNSNKDFKAVVKRHKDETLAKQQAKQKDD